MPSAARELARLGALLDRIDRLLAEPPERLVEPRPDVSGWSAAQHLLHVSLANEMSLENATRLVDGRSALARPLEPLDPRAADLLHRGRLPRGTDAPRFVRPPARVDLALLADVHAGARAKASALAERPDAVDAAGDTGAPHQSLGVLTAAQWVRFARMHTAHHLTIARTLLP